MKEPVQFLSDEEKERVFNAITHAESITTGRIRVRIEKKSGKEPLVRARQVFTDMGLKDSADRNNVLFFISIADRRLAVFGDDALNAKVPEGFWEMVVNAVTDRFEDGEYGIGLAGGISLVAGKLAEFFPDEKEAPEKEDSLISYEEKK